MWVRVDHSLIYHERKYSERASERAPVQCCCELAVRMLASRLLLPVAAGYWPCVGSSHHTRCSSPWYTHVFSATPHDTVRAAPPSLMTPTAILFSCLLARSLIMRFSRPPVDPSVDETANRRLANNIPT